MASWPKVTEDKNNVRARYLVVGDRLRGTPGTITYVRLIPNTTVYPASTRGRVRVQWTCDRTGKLREGYWNANTVIGVNR